MVLHPVILTRADSCITYALKRVGVSYSSRDNIDSNWFHNKIREGLFVKMDKKDIKRGYLRLLDKPPLNSNSLLSTGITKDGLILTRKTRIEGFHMQVIEDVENDLVSEMFEGAFHFPEIRIMRRTPSSQWVNYSVCWDKQAES